PRNPALRVTGSPWRTKHRRPVRSTRCRSRRLPTKRGSDLVKEDLFALVHLVLPPPLGDESQRVADACVCVDGLGFNPCDAIAAHAAFSASSASFWRSDTSHALPSMAALRMESTSAGVPCSMEWRSSP